jgi:hypothetical protein
VWARPTLSGPRRACYGSAPFRDVLCRRATGLRLCTARALTTREVGTPPDRLTLRCDRRRYGACFRGRLSAAQWSKLIKHGLRIKTKPKI